MVDMRGEVEAILKKLAQVLDISSLSLDANNKCLILFDDKIVLNIEFSEEEGVLFIYSFLGLVPFFSKERILEHLLEANFFWKGSNGSTFAIDKQSRTLILEKKFNVEGLDYNFFEDSLTIFVDTVEYWTKTIHDIETEAENLLSNDDSLSSSDSSEKNYGSWKL